MLADSQPLVPPTTRSSGVATRSGAERRDPERQARLLQCDEYAAADPELADLLEELAAYPCDQPEEEPHGPGEVVVPLRIRVDDNTELAMLSTVATFGTPLDVTVAELVIESFFPADEETAAWLRGNRGGQPAGG